MTKREEERPSRSNAEQKLPKGHFNDDGVSQGQQSGAVRKTPDAYQGERPPDGESK